MDVGLQNICQVGMSVFASFIFIKDSLMEIGSDQMSTVMLVSIRMVSKT